MRSGVAPGEEPLDRLPEQLGALVAEQLLEPGVGEHDDPVAVGDQQTVG
jgi:hypothetical protein